jgi:hypothetical protein
MFNLKIDSEKVHPWKKGFFVLVPKRDKHGHFTNSYNIKFSLYGFLTTLEIVCFCGIGAIALYAFGLV